MAYQACSDCGTRMYDGTCPNCQEELYIFETQGEYLPANLSDEFQDKVADQRIDRDVRLDSKHR